MRIYIKAPPGLSRGSRAARRLGLVKPSRPPEWRCIHDLEAGHTLKLLGIEGGDFVPERETRCGDLQIMWTDHLPARLKLRPDSGVNARLRQVKRLNGQGGQDLLNVPLTPCLSG